ncbi:MAG TPA: heavy metal translocating P-type ATPase metal-binding domain-containing protein [Saprospiraceae bacterium]|nr:heavy metal translocating P-type ATPase metal-binding domain-containing protein [Saprospiraceae bacterium]
MATSSVLLQPKTPAPEALQCFHCHEACPDDRLHLDDKYFCCQGCQMVYEILNTHNMCEFYDLDQNAGKSLKAKKASKNYAYLDDQEIREKLLEFESNTTAQVTFYLPNMHCVSCIWLLENLYKLDTGVVNSRVNFLKKTTTIQFNPNQTSLRKLAALLDTIGYEPDINLGDVDGQKKPAMSRKLAYQLAIAGFAFGNVMLFSFPEYVGMSREQDPWFSEVFGYLSLLISLPVLLYSEKDYFISAWQGLRNRQLNIDVPLCLAFISLFGRSVYEILTHTGAGYLDSFAGLTFLMLIGKWFQQHVWHQLSFERDYKSYFPVAATVRSGDTETTVPVSRLVPGDIILVRSQEVIPADGILLKGTASVDYSFVTGESEPVLVHNGERIFAGGKQTGESIEIALTRRVAQSHLTKLWNNEAFKTNSKGQVTQLADAAGRYFTYLILAFGGGGVLYWWGMRGDVATAVNAFTAVMIVACPCNVALSIPFTLGNIQRIMGRYRFYLKNIRVVESFSEIDTVVFDKTGTITNVAQQEMKFVGQSLSAADKIAIRSLVRHSSHPLSRKIYETLQESKTESPETYQEIPGMGIQGRFQGREWKIGSREFLGLSDCKEAGKGLNGSVFVAVDEQCLGFYEVKSRYRDGLAKVLAYFREKKGATPASLFLLSGDQDREAQALTSFFPEKEAMRFQQSPQDKLDFVRSKQEKGHKVMMLGDGLNDAGALRQSELGIVVAENTNNFTPACDAILHAEEFSRLPQLIDFAKAGVRIVNLSYVVALTYNAIGLSFGVSGNLSPFVAAVLMPISSVSMVLFSVGLSNRAARRILK